MDRLDALHLFAAVAETGGFAARARRVGVSPASVTRAANGLEDRLGLKLFTRTTLSVRLTELGRAYLDRIRHVLDALGQADGTADVVLVDRVLNLIDEGFDVALRIGPLPDGALIARRVGAVRRVVCAFPAYLEEHGTPEAPDDLARHAIVAAAPVTPTTDWRFADDVSVRLTPRLTVNAVEVAIGAAIRGQGVTRVLSYQVADAVAAGDLRIVLARFEPVPLPIHLVHVEGHAASAKLRAFLDMAGAALRDRLAWLRSRARMFRSSSRIPKKGPRAFAVTSQKRHECGTSLPAERVGERLPI